MSSTTVAEFASELKKSTDTLLEQLKSAGVAKAAASDKLTDADKQRLLSYLQASHGTPSPERKKITLVKKSTSEIKQADASGKARTIQVEVRKKRTFVRREDGVEVAVESPSVEHELDSESQAENAELARREEDARRQAEMIRLQEEELTERRRQREQQELLAREIAEQAASQAAARALAEKAEQAEQARRQAPAAQAQEVTNNTALKVAEAAEKADAAAKAQLLAREKEVADSKARAAEDVARAADLGDRRRKAEAEAAAIRMMMSSPAKKAPVPKKPEDVKPDAAKAGIKGTLHKPAASAVVAKPAKVATPGSAAPAAPGTGKEVKSAKLSSSWAGDPKKAAPQALRQDVAPTGVRLRAVVVVAAMTVIGVMSASKRHRLKHASLRSMCPRPLRSLNWLTRWQSRHLRSSSI